MAPTLILSPRLCILETVWQANCPTQNIIPKSLHSSFNDHKFSLIHTAVKKKSFEEGVHHISCTAWCLVLCCTSVINPLGIPKSNMTTPLLPYNLNVDIFDILSKIFHHSVTMAKSNAEKFFFSAAIQFYFQHFLFNISSRHTCGSMRYIFFAFAHYCRNTCRSLDFCLSKQYF